MRNDLQLSAWSVSVTGAGWADDFYESIFFLGNGRMGVRGYSCAEPDARSVHRGLYLAGIFGEIRPGITDFVNLPTPVASQIRINNVQGTLASGVERVLDLKQALLTLRYTLRAGESVLDVTEQRFFPRQQPALILQRLILTPRTDLALTIVSGVCTDSCNCPIPDDQTKANAQTVQLSQLQSAHVSEGSVCCAFEIQGTGLRVTQTARFAAPGFRFSCSDGGAAVYTAAGKEGRPLVFDKAACIRTSRDVDPRLAPLPDDWSYDALLDEHTRAWQAVWDRCDLTLPVNDADMQTGLRYAIFQLFGSCSAKDPTVSIGARGLSHGRYKGCYFWDTDLFMLPFFVQNDPEAAKNLCLYRVRALPAAKAHAKKMNAAGARYPWMAALDGSEQCETWDIGCSELHVTADVAYALDAYCRATNDEAFYLDGAAEVYIETARFWLSRYTFDEKTGRADLLFCKGPDEYCGITSNNLFTNVMVQHNLDLALRAAEDLHEKRPACYARLGITPQELLRMQALRRAIRWPRDPVTHRLTQDETFHLLEPVPRAALKPDASASYHRVCFDRLQRYKLIKQADVLLIMTRLPQLFTDEEKRAAWDDFEPLCLHDSTLSFASHALFALQNGLYEQGLSYLRRALLLDLRDIMQNTGHEGLHLACMGEAWQAAQTLLTISERQA